MKKIFFCILIGCFPLLINAQTESEVKYKWYNIVEENIRYEQDVENICEYFDKKDFIYDSWNKTINKPEEKDGREITEGFIEYEISRYYADRIEIKKFVDLMNKSEVKINEIEFFDKNNNLLEYSIETNDIQHDPIDYIHDKNYETGIIVDGKERNLNLIFNEPINIKDMIIKVHYDNQPLFKHIYFRAYIAKELKVNTFDDSVEFVTKECNDQNKCVLEITTNVSGLEHEPLIVKTYGYSFRDKLYKCFNKTKKYVDGYYNDLSYLGYIKDEEDFIIETKEIIEENVSDEKANELVVPNIIYCPNPNINEIPIKEEIITENISNDVNDSNKESNLKPSTSQIAYVTKEKSKEKIPNYLSFLTTFLILSIMLAILIIRKKVKNVERNK